MDIQTFNQQLVDTSNELVNFNKYSDNIINTIFIKNGVFKELHELSEKKGHVIPLSLLEKYCNLKITSSTSLKTIGLENKKDYKKNKDTYYLTFNAFEKSIKNYSKEYQEYIQKIGEHYGNYCHLFYQKEDLKDDSSSKSENSESETNSSDSESESESSDESENESEDSEEEIIISCPDNIRIYNKELIEGKKNPSIVEYVKALNEKFYKIDISFIDDFLKLVGTNECIIPHMMLEKYGVLKIKNSSDVKRKLDNFYLIENIDYKINGRNIAPIKKKTGTIPKNYLLSSYAFKLCLMRSQNTRKYANYFLLLEECVKYFNDFHLERNLMYRVCLKRLVKQKDKTIQRKECKIDELNETVKRIEKMNERMEKSNLDMKNTNERMEKSNLEMKKTVEDTNSQLLEISKDLKTVISKVSEFNVSSRKQKALSEVIGICKEPNFNNGYESYHIVRCQNKNYDRLIKDKKDKYNAQELFRIDTNNSALCWHSMKQYFESNKRFITDAYSFKYRGLMDEDRLQEMLNDSVKTIKSRVSGR